MALPGSGALSFPAIQTEFGGTNPISISEYYRLGGLVADTPANAGIPTSGQISLSGFYGAAAFSPTTVTRTSGTGATETVPTGATSVRIRVGGGGDGGGGVGRVGGAGGTASGGTTNTTGFAGEDGVPDSTGLGGNGASTQSGEGGEGGNSLVFGSQPGFRGEIEFYYT